MITADKYEGCSKTAWRCVGQPYTELAEAMAAILRNGPDTCTPADLELWADAPLILQALIDEQAEVKRLRARIEQAISTLRSQPNDLEDGPDYHRELLSFLDGAICHAIDVLEGKE